MKWQLGTEGGKRMFYRGWVIYKPTHDNCYYASRPNVKWNGPYCSNLNNLKRKIRAAQISGRYYSNT